MSIELPKRALVAGWAGFLCMAALTASTLCFGGECPDSAIHPELLVKNLEGECGTGAVVPWAGSLWVITYGPHLPLESSDKLYQITPDLKQIVRAESVGGTHANRMIHRESNQLVIGSYVIDATGGVRVVNRGAMPGRLTGVARHLTDPSNKVYVATMETGLYELDVNTLEVNTLIREDGMNDRKIAEYLEKHGMQWPNGWGNAPRTKVPGYHSKGLNSGFGKVFISNNGENTDEAKVNPFQTSGVLAWWNSIGEDWTKIFRRQYTEIATRDDIYGNEHPQLNPIWAMGWDAKSVVLSTTVDGVKWTSYRLPKASHAYDGAHGWNTEWPRIRDVGEKDYMLATMHGTFWRFPKSFSPSSPNGIRPISTYLKVIGDFCRWGDWIVFGCDDHAMNEFLGKRALKRNAPKRDHSESNLWFVKPEALSKFGPPSGEGWVWYNESVKAGDVSDPFLWEGYEDHRFTFKDANGVDLPFELIHEGDWVRVRALADAKSASAHFRYGPAKVELPKLDKAVSRIRIVDDNGRAFYLPNVNGDTNVICREVVTERDLLYAGGVFYEVPAENAGGFEVMRPIALSDGHVRSIDSGKGFLKIDGKAMPIDNLWFNGTAPQAYWLWEKAREEQNLGATIPVRHVVKHK